jgi:hypothetical protein
LLLFLTLIIVVNLSLELCFDLSSEGVYTVGFVVCGGDSSVLADSKVVIAEVLILISG